MAIFAPGAPDRWSLEPTDRLAPASRRTFGPRPGSPHGCWPGCSRGTSAVTTPGSHCLWAGRLDLPGAPRPRRWRSHYALLAVWDGNVPVSA